MHPAQSPSLAVRGLATPLQDEADDYDELMAMAEEKGFMLLGEAAHRLTPYFTLTKPKRLNL